MNRARARWRAAALATGLCLGLGIASAMPAPGRSPTTFRIVPVRPVPELLSEALQQAPPAEEGEFLASDLVDITQVEPGIRLDIRYASSDNFLSQPVYPEARAFLQRPAAEALGRVHRALAQKGYGLLVHDAYRPWYVTWVFWQATPPEQHGFVADPAEGSRHNRGCAVDLGLYELESGAPVAMPSGYDEMSERARADYPGGSADQRQARQLLHDAMAAEGFTVLPEEWWHFDYRDWRRYRIENRRFSELAGPRDPPRRRSPLRTFRLAAAVPDSAGPGG